MGGEKGRFMDARGKQGHGDAKGEGTGDGQPERRRGDKPFRVPRNDNSEGLQGVCVEVTDSLVYEEAIKQ